jgi:hypothetical protein
MGLADLTKLVFLAPLLLTFEYCSWDCTTLHFIYNHTRPITGIKLYSLIGSSTHERIYYYIHVDIPLETPTCLWPVIVRSNLPSYAPQTLTVLSAAELASHCPSGLNLTLETALV